MSLSQEQAAREAVPAESGIYEADFHAWSVQQTQALRQRDLEALDWENVAEEIESLGREQGNAWVSLCGRVIEHMLKIEHCEGDEHLAHRDAEIQRWRLQMADRLRDNPSLTGSYREIFGRAWDRGRRDAIVSMLGWAGLQPGSKAGREHGRSLDEMLPATCPYRLLEVTAYDTEKRNPEVQFEVFPPDVAGILNDRTGAGYPVRPWTGLDRRLRQGPQRISGPSR